MAQNEQRQEGSSQAVYYTLKGTLKGEKRKIGAINSETTQENFPKTSPPSERSDWGPTYMGALQKAIRPDRKS